MPAQFPNSLPPAGSAVASDTLATAGHTGLHNDDRDEILALAAKLGITSSTASSGVPLVGTGAGSSEWKQLNLTTGVTGILPPANGGVPTSVTTGTGALVLKNAPTISNPGIDSGGTWSGGPTISGGGAWNGSPSFSAPFVSDFTNMNHAHDSVAHGGVIGPQTYQNPYKFSVYLSGAQNATGGSVYTKILFDTKNFDTSSNFDAVTNHRFTAPIAGFYFFTGTANVLATTSDYLLLEIFQNGVESTRGTQMVSPGPNTNSQTISGFLQLSLNDTIDLRVFNGAAADKAMGTGTAPQVTHFSGFLVSAT